jgi:hypothetical protein
MSLESLLWQRATIERAARSVSSAGDVTAAWTPVAPDVPCLVEIRDVETDAGADGLALHRRARAFFPAGTDLRPRAGVDGRDRVTVEGARWRVTGARIVTGRRARLLVADLEAID